MHTINELVEDVLKGDEIAFAKLVELYKGVAYLYIDRYCLLYPDLMNRKDLYQLSLHSLYKSVVSYDRTLQTLFTTYYSVLLERDILMYLRSVRTQKNKSNVFAISLDNEINETNGVYLVETLENTNDAFEPEKYANNAIFYECIETHLKRYPVDERDIFKMWMQGFSYSEISERYKISHKQVEYIIHKIKVYLRTVLKDWRKD